MTIMNNAAMNINVQVFVWIYIFIFIGNMPNNGIANPYDNCIKTFEYLPECFPKWWHFILLPKIYEASIFSTILPIFFIICLLIRTILECAKWYLIVVLKFAFSWWLMILSMFSYFLAFMYLLKKLFRSSLQFLAELFIIEL